MRRFLAAVFFFVAPVANAQIMPPAVPPTLTAEAPYLLFDNFPGTSTALNGKAPVIGNGAGTYQVTGANLANAMSGNGNAMLNVASGNAYVQYQLASAPGEIGFTFEFAQSNATGANPTTANYPALFTANFSGLHPQVNLTNFATTYFSNGVSNQPTWSDNNVYTTLSTNTVYTVRIFIEAPYVHQFLFDPTGAQIGYQVINDPNLTTSIGAGTWVFFQLFDGATNLTPFGVTYHSWWARAKQPQTVSQTYYRGGLDQSPIGLRIPQPLKATTLSVGNMTPRGAFSVAYDSTVWGGTVYPRITNIANSGDSVFELQSSGAVGGSEYRSNTHDGFSAGIGIDNGYIQFIRDYNNIRWLVRPPYDGVNEYSRYPYTTAGIRIGGSAGPYWYSGSGAPAIDAPIGSLYSNTAGGAATTTYFKFAAGAANWLPLSGVAASTSPTAAAGAGAGTTPPAPVVTAGANSPRGNITFGTGTVPAAGAQVVVTFAAALSSAPAVVMLQASNAATSGLGLYPSSITATGFTVSATTAPAASQVNTTYSFNYTEVQ